MERRQAANLTIDRDTCSKCVSVSSFSMTFPVHFFFKVLFFTREHTPVYNMSLASLALEEFKRMFETSKSYLAADIYEK